MLELERRSTRSHSLESPLWKWVWTSRKIDYGMNEQGNKDRTLIEWCAEFVSCCVGSILMLLRDCGRLLLHDMCS